MANDKTPPTIAAKVDELGNLRAEMKALKDKMAKVEDDLISYSCRYDKTCLNGKAYKVAVSVGERAVVAWKSIAETFKPSNKLVKRFTNHIPVTSVRCYAHKK